MPLESTEIQADEFEKAIVGMIVTEDNVTSITYDIRGGWYATKHKPTGRHWKFRLDKSKEETVVNATETIHKDLLPG